MTTTSSRSICPKSQGRGAERQLVQRPQGRHPQYARLLRACLANGCHISVDSDAHSTHQLQHGLTALYAMLEEMQFPQELIVNATRENLVQELQLHGKPCAEEVGGILL